MLVEAEDDTTPDPQPDRVDSEVTSSRISEWLVGVDPSGADEAAPARAPQQAAGTLPEDDEIALPDKYGYRQVVFESAAYKTLVARLQRQALLTPLTEADAMMTIRRRILQQLPQTRHLSRQTESETFSIVLRAPWDPLAFLRDQYEGPQDPGELLGRVITLTGSMGDAQALPCSEYLSQTWPTTGPHMLAAVTEALETGEKASSRSTWYPLPFKYSHMAKRLLL